MNLISYGKVFKANHTVDLEILNKKFWKEPIRLLSLHKSFI
jgi:hypothetical protein